MLKDIFFKKVRKNEMEIRQYQIFYTFAPQNDSVVSN